MKSDGELQFLLHMDHDNVMIEQPVRPLLSQQCQQLYIIVNLLEKVGMQKSYHNVSVKAMQTMNSLQV